MVAGEELAQFLIQSLQTRAQCLGTLDSFRNSRLADTGSLLKRSVTDLLGFPLVKSSDRALGSVGQANRQPVPKPRRADRDRADGTDWYPGQRVAEVLFKVNSSAG